MILEGKIILVVEDNVVNRVTYQIALMKSGAHVVFERWGDGTITTLQMYSHIDLIIMDLMLKRQTNGFIQAQKIRLMPEYRHIPIIAVSAAEPYEAMAKCREMGFNGYIPKPIQEELFATQLAAVLNGEELWVMP